jgi:Polyketide cyclase / dehydrase and lipid transport
MNGLKRLNIFGDMIMTKHSFSASKLISSPAQRVYDLIADYRNGHPRILPKPYFVSLEVEQGGYGAETIINYQMQLMGRIQSFHSTITEPEPGHILVETEMNTGAVTTFTVDPRVNGQEAFVTITTSTNVPDGILGKIQGWLTTRLLRPIYEKELDQLAAVAKEQVR